MTIFGANLVILCAMIGAKIAKLIQVTVVQVIIISSSTLREL